MYMCVIILFFTLRGKAIAGGAVYALLVYFVLIRKKRMRVWHFLIVGAVALVIGWEQLQYYYAELEGQSARSVLTLTSLEIMKDYFPIGTGFATYASAAAAEHYSPVYVQYGFMYIHELGGNSRGSGFFSDTFWPIIIGQTGVVGMLFYVSALASLMRRVMSIRKVDECAYVMGIFVFIYLFISSTSESAFHNPLAVPLAALLGYVFTLEKKKELYL